METSLIEDPEDAAIAVEFTIEPFPDPAKSADSGKPEFRDVEMVRIFIDKNTVWYGEVTDEHRERFAVRYAKWKKSKGVGISGTPLCEVSWLNRSTIASYNALNVFSVEQLANASDATLQDLGMGARANKEKARVYLKKASEDAADLKLAGENVKLKNELEYLKQELAELKASFPKPSTVKKRSK